MTSPFFTRSPFFTMGFWLRQVFWLRALVLEQVVDVDLGRHVGDVAGTSAFTTMRLASTASTMPSRLATQVTPESRATIASMPGAHQRRLGAEQRHRLALHVACPSARGWRRRSRGTE